MTRSDLEARARAAWDGIRSLPATTLLLAAVVALSLLLVRQCNRAGRAEDGAARAAEGARVEAQRIAVAHAVTAEGLARMLAAAADREKNATGRASNLEAEVARLLAAAPGAHLVSAEAGDTGWIPTGGGTAAPAPAPGGGLSAAPSGGAPPPGRVCWFYEGDEGRIVPVLVRAKYRAGTIGVVGVADAFGRAPLPAAAAAAGVTAAGRHLFGGPLTIDAKQVEDLPRAPDWAFGLGGGASELGALGAVLVQTPSRELPLFHWPARAWFLAAGGARQGLVLAGVNVEP